MKLPDTWAVFPLHPVVFDADGPRCGCDRVGCKQAGKHPAAKWGDLAPGEKIIWDGDYGLGLATGPRSGVVIVDLDNKPGVDGLGEFLRLSGGELPSTLTVATPSGGVHLYFKWPGYKVKSSAGEIAPGVDIRGDGGYAVLPPTVHKSGGCYEFVGLPADFTGDLTDLIADLPGWLGPLVQGGGVGYTAPPLNVPGLGLPSLELPEGTTTQEGWATIDRVVKRLKGLEQGRRNNTLFELCAVIGDHSYLGEIALDDARRAITNSVFIGEGWEDLDKCLDTMERGFKKGRSKERPMIIVGPAHYEINEQAITALAGEDDVYVLGNRLARATGGGGIGSNGLGVMTRNNLGETLSRCVDWRTRGKEGDLKRAHPPDWSVAEIYDRGYWDGLRVVEGFSKVPLLRRDGSVAGSREGYDADLRVLFDKAHDQEAWESLDAQDAAWVLSDVVCDYPFASDSHLAAWICSVLTPLALYAFDGPAPLFLFEASTAGSGKTLLVATSGIISTGETPALMTFRGDDGEMRKTITTHAMNPKPLVFMDNVTGEFGGAALCAALSIPDRVWSDRVLGGNVGFTGKMNTVWYATGNNVRLGADMERRICPIRLTPRVERPELRTGFRHELPDFAWKHREELTGAALALLSGYVKAGRPKAPGVPWGSYEGWYKLVVGACAWAGFGTPNEALEELRESGADRTEEGSELVAAWLHAQKTCDPNGFTTQEVYDLCYPKGSIMGAPTPGFEGLRNVFDNRFPKGVSTRLIGYMLRDYRDRTFKSGALRQPKWVNGKRKWVVE